MRKIKRCLCFIMVMTIILTGISLSFSVSAASMPGAAMGFTIFSGNSYPAQPSFSVRLQNVCTLTGFSNAVNGSVHSNYNIDANTSFIIGTAEAVGTVTGDNILTKISGAPYVPMPDYSIYKPQIKADAMAAGQYFSGNFSIANKASVNLNSPVYVEGSANLTGISFSGSGCLYAGGKISITGSTTSYDSAGKISFYSGYTSTNKSDAAIDFSGSTKNFTGMLYAPNGSILVSGSNYTFSGNIIGRVVDVAGSNKTFYSSDISESFKYACAFLMTFNANGGLGGTSNTMAYGATFLTPTVTKAGYIFTGWSPSVPATVPAADATYTAQWIQLGDVNASESITPVDALMALQSAAGKIILTQIQFSAADVNLSNSVTPIDALKILQYAAGEILTF